MKEYCTLVVSDVSEPFTFPKFSVPSNRLPIQNGRSMLQALMHDGWEVIDASVLPKLSTHDDAPRFAFMLEREIPLPPSTDHEL